MCVYVCMHVCMHASLSLSLSPLSMYIYIYIYLSPARWRLAAAAARAPSLSLSLYIYIYIYIYICISIYIFYISPARLRLAAAAERETTLDFPPRGAARIRAGRRTCGRMRQRPCLAAWPGPRGSGRRGRAAAASARTPARGMAYGVWRVDRREARFASKRSPPPPPRPYSNGILSYPHTPCTPRSTRRNEQALVSLKLKKIVDAGVGRTFSVIIQGGLMSK